MTTQTNIDQLSDRIESAYRRMHGKFHAIGLTPGAWTAAAIRLNEVAVRNPRIPVDPELFVAVQNYRTFRRDPWRELAQEGSTRRYRSTIRRIVKQLKEELVTELRLSNRFLGSGRSLDEVIAIPRSRVSPIAKLILCSRHDREDLAKLVRPAAKGQHLACPLYSLACKKLIPDSAYPDLSPEPVGFRGIPEEKLNFAWN